MKTNYRVAGLGALLTVSVLFGCASPDDLERVKGERDRFQAKLARCEEQLEEQLEEKSERIAALESELEEANVRIGELQNQMAAIRAETPETEEPAPAVDEGIGYLDVQAVYARDGAAADRVRYTVQTKEGEVKEGPGRQSSFELESGDYIVVAEVGAVKKTVEVGVQAEERKERQIVLDAGILEVGALLTEDGPEAPDMVIEVRSAERNIRGEHELITGPHGRRSSFVLPADTYLARVKSGQAEAEKEVVVEAGERTEASLILDAGILEVDALLAEDGPEAPDTVIEVRSAERNIRGEHELITGPHRRHSSFVLPADTYLVRVKSGQAEAEREVVMEAGERTDSSVVMRAGTLHAQARQADGAPVSADVRWSVFAICDETHEEEEVVAFSRSKEFVLPHGTYVVQAHVGEQEFQKEVEIGSGEDIQMEIEIDEM